MRCSSTDPHGKSHLKTLKKLALQNMGLKKKDLGNKISMEHDLEFWRNISKGSKVLTISKIQKCRTSSLAEEALMLSPFAGQTPFLRKCKAYTVLHNRAMLELCVAINYHITPGTFSASTLLPDHQFLYFTHKKPFYTNRKPIDYVYPITGLPYFGGI